jgi:hypothetical protein
LIIIRFTRRKPSSTPTPGAKRLASAGSRCRPLPLPGASSF